MSFSAYARKVRDPSLPYGRRVSALRSCVQLYRPIGFHATLSFLKEIAGGYDRDEAALLRALDALMASRAGWHADVRAYAATRRQAKRRGQRSPRPGERNPSNVPEHWYGAPDQAALHALKFWRRERPAKLLSERDPVAEMIRGCLDAALASNGSLSPDQRRTLADSAAELRRRVGTNLWYDDQPAYFRTLDLLKVARLLQIADRPAGP
ncbi:hypothetical protein ACVCAH_05035 [Micromonospora sp. LZ34]